MRLAGAILSEGTQTHLRCLAHHGHRLARKKVVSLELKDILLFSEPSAENKVLELDELWSFVYPKSEKVWVWLALCRESRQEVVAFVIGDRRAGQPASVCL